MTEEKKSDNQIKPKQKYSTRWYLHGVTIDDQENLQVALDNGYEPFAIITQFMPVENKSQIVEVGKPQQINIKPVHIMYFRMKCRVPVDANGKELSQVIYKRKEKDGLIPPVKKEEVSNVTELKPKA